VFEALFHKVPGYLKLIRPKEWIKNIFLFIPLFFAGKSFNLPLVTELFGGFACFSMVASGLYILNDLRDIKSDQIHPIKRNRPLASGWISKYPAIILMILLWILGLSLGYVLKPKFGFILGIYWILNLAYSFGLKDISILDILMVSAGFVLRVKAGGAITNIYVSNWLIIMVFLLSLIMSIAKRRDDLLLKLKSGVEIRKAGKGYNLDFLNTVLGLISGITVMAYIMYTISPEVMARHNSYRLYYTCIFVIAGILRYLQITFVEGESGSPTLILYKDRFIQFCIILWIISFYFILYIPDIQLFSE
jgi:4-hydroxybenzoate polyprenyltransferase